MTTPPPPPISPGPPIIPGPPDRDHTQVIQPPVIVKKIHPMSWVLVGLGVLALLCGGIMAIGSVAGNPTAGAVPTPSTVTVTVPVPVAAAPPTTTGPPPSPTKAPPPPPPEIEDGIWTVGTDIPAGRYRAKEAVSADCYWSITKSGTNGSDIIENDIPGGGRPQVVLKRGQDFTSQDCGTWVKVG